MKCLCLPLVLLSLIPCMAIAQKADGKFAKDLENLRLDHQTKVREALEPINKRYLHDLETLLKRATFDNDLETAVKVRKELSRIQPESSAPFVGQWEYEYKGSKYRRIIYSNGGVALWRSGKNWLRPDGKPWWDNHTWKMQGTKLRLRTDTGEDVFEWSLADPDTVIQKDLRSGVITKMYRGKDVWK